MRNAALSVVCGLGIFLVFSPTNGDNLSTNCSGYVSEIRRDFPSPQTSATAVCRKMELATRCRSIHRRYVVPQRRTVPSLLAEAISRPSDDQATSHTWAV